MVESLGWHLVPRFDPFHYHTSFILQKEHVGLLLETLDKLCRTIFYDEDKEDIYVIFITGNREWTLVSTFWIGQKSIDLSHSQCGWAPHFWMGQKNTFCKTKKYKFCSPFLGGPKSTFFFPVQCTPNTVLFYTVLWCLKDVGMLIKLPFILQSFVIVSDPNIAKRILKDNSKAYSKVSVYV